MNVLRLLVNSLLCRDTGNRDLMRDIPGENGIVGSYGCI